MCQAVRQTDVKKQNLEKYPAKEGVDFVPVSNPLKEQ